MEIETNKTVWHSRLFVKKLEPREPPPCSVLLRYRRNLLRGVFVISVTAGSAVCSRSDAADCSLFQFNIPRSSCTAATVRWWRHGRLLAWEGTDATTTFYSSKLAAVAKMAGKVSFQNPS